VLFDRHPSLGDGDGLPESGRRDYWQRGAELGWTSLLVSEAAGGVSISNSGLVGLTLAAHEFGRHAAPGPLVSTNVVAGALSAAGADDDLIAGLLSGTSIATWCLTEAPPHDSLSNFAFEIAIQGNEVVLNGVMRAVEAAHEASHLLSTGRTGEGPRWPRTSSPSACSGCLAKSLDRDLPFRDVPRSRSKPG
jgi:alkylation response protein AidB-like acyl-CoA dehydrogenase